MPGPRDALRPASWLFLLLVDDGGLVDVEARGRLEPLRAVRPGLDRKLAALGGLGDRQGQLVDLRVGRRHDGLGLRIDEDALAARGSRFEEAGSVVLAATGGDRADANDVLSSRRREVAPQRSEGNPEGQDDEG